MNELQVLFASNGVNMTSGEIQGFFEICKVKNKGFLDLTEFSALYKNKSADDKFRMFI